MTKTFEKNSIGFIFITHLLFSFVLLNQLQAQEVNLNQRIFTTTKRDTGIFTQRLDNQGRTILEKAFTLPKETRFSFRPSTTLVRPLFRKDNGQVANSPGRYFGKILIDTDMFTGDDLAKVKELNKVRIFIYEWHIDKLPYLRALFDQDIPSYLRKFTPTNTLFWDEVSTKGLWSSQAAHIMKTSGKILLENPPSDITDFCPRYFEFKQGSREQVTFWLQLLNSIMKRESAFDLLVGNDESNFGGGNTTISRGALQISYGSLGRHYRHQGCKATSAEELHQFSTNINCGVAIFKHLTRQDGCISCRSTNNKWAGIARYWSTLRERYEVSCKICSSGKAKVGYKKEIIAEIADTPNCRLYTQ